MEKVLEKINNTKDLKKINEKEKIKLAEEIRELLIETVSKNGGHLASNLGIVELTIAIHSIFDVDNDKIIWDVGHQSYVHKILTGRKDKINSIRKLDGIAGFPKTSENKADCFNTGHSSTSISVALGMARSRDIKNEKYRSIAVIGDGALTGGMALEALNDAGCSNTNVTVILNDNNMSISKNVGGMTTFLSKLRTKKLYTRTNAKVKKIVRKIPLIGNGLVYLAQKIKRGIKQLFIKKMYFEDIGFTYLGPVDGHDIEKLESILDTSKQIEGPVLIHVITKKGKGYKFAEENPDKFHSTSSFDINTGKPLKEKKKDYSAIFGQKLTQLAKENNKIVAITAAMKDGTGLTEFAKEFPNRFFDVGIAEQHALGMAAGMAKDGLIPVVPIYSSFYQRGYDQVIHDICIQNLPVIMCVDRAGVVGSDGETHQGIFDLSFFNIIPNITIMAPKDFKELANMLEYAVNLNKPVVIRYPRGSEEKSFEKQDKINLGKSEVLRSGKDITILAIGKMVSRACKIAEILKAKEIEAEVINVRFLKPLDEKILIDSIIKTKNVITIEDNILKGGLATSVNELIIKNNIKDIKIQSFGYPDEFIKHGEIGEIEEIHGLGIDNIVNSILK